MIKHIANCLVRLYTKSAAYLLKKAIYDIKSNAAKQAISDGILLVGDESSVKFFQSSIAKIRTHDLQGFTLVQRYIKGILLSPIPLKRGFIINTVFCTEQHRTQLTEERFAALLVRYAVQCRIVSMRIYPMACYNKRCRFVSYNRELRSMKLLNCSDESIHQQHQFIAEVNRNQGGGCKWCHV